MRLCVIGHNAGQKENGWALLNQPFYRMTPLLVNNEL